MTKECKNFMEWVEDKVVNYKQPMFCGTDPDRIYYSSFGDTDNSDDKFYIMGKRSKIRNRLKLTRLTLKH